ncbi:hypothetical protein SAMN02745115_00933 [[Eubacterium] yurii]|jgi:hypothetical protein|nr:hypothetical protein SAMN02745115_00933 [[Eubacterium] yurii]
MGFLDQLGDAAKNIGAAAGDLAKQVGEKASDAIEISKINSKISAEKAEIEKEMKKISEALYDKFSKGGDIPEEIKEFCDNIKTRYLDIDKLKEEIEKVKNTVGEKVEEVKEAVKDKAEDAKDAVKDKAEDVKDAVVEGAEKAQDAVEDAMK